MSHTVTAAEAADLDLLRDNIVAEWNASENENIAKFTMAAEPTPSVATPSYYRFVSFTVNTRIEGKDWMDVSIDTSQQGNETYAVFILPYDILNFSDELETGTLTVHLQSRPLSYGYQYAHIHRVVDMVRTSLVYNTHNITVSLYGSDDLHTWTLLTYANRKDMDSTKPLHISQLRTAPAARSWRYYTIVIGGIIPIDTDFGPVLIESEPVVRRIG